MSENQPEPNDGSIESQHNAQDAHACEGCGTDHSDPMAVARAIEKKITDSRVRVHRDEEGEGYVHMGDLVRTMTLFVNLQLVGGIAAGSSPQANELVHVGQTKLTENTLNFIYDEANQIAPTKVEDIPDTVPEGWGVE